MVGQANQDDPVRKHAGINPVFKHVLKRNNGKAFPSGALK